MEILLAMMVLLVATLLTLPTWPYSAKWGYVPTSACGATVVTLVALVLTGRF